jgi:hypothetical protein
MEKVGKNKHFSFLPIYSLTYSFQNISYEHILCVKCQVL